MGLVRSTSDHIAWLIVDPSEQEPPPIPGVFPPESSLSSSSALDMISKYYHDIKKYTEAFVSNDDVVVFLPSLGENVFTHPPHPPPHPHYYPHQYHPHLLTVYTYVICNVIPKPEALYQLNIIKLRHKPIDHTNLFGDSILELPSSVVLQSNTKKMNTATATSGGGVYNNANSNNDKDCELSEISSQSNSMIIFGYLINYMLIWIEKERTILSNDKV